MRAMRPLLCGTLATLGLLVGRAVAQDAPRAPPPEPVAERAAVRLHSMVGVVSATRALDVLPQVDGRLEQLKVQLGDRVKAGQVVALLDTRARQFELSARQAQEEATGAELSRSTLLLKQAQQQWLREKRIRDYSTSESLEKAEHAVALAGVEVDLARARHSQAQAEVALSNEVLEQARIRAPFDGRVSEEYLQPGMMASRTTPILRLVGEERLLRFAIPEALAGAVRPGDAVRIHAGAATPSFPGVVERISPELDAVSRHVKAEARLDALRRGAGLAAHRRRRDGGVRAGQAP